MGRKLYRFVSMHPLTARAAVADGFDFEALLAFAQANYAELTDDQASAFKAIVVRFVHHLVEYALGVDAKDMREHAHRAVDQLQKVLVLLGDTPAYAGNPLYQSGPSATYVHPDARSKLMGNLFLTHLSVLNQQMREVESLAFEIGNDDLIPAVASSAIDPIQFAGLMQVIKDQALSLSESYDSRNDNIRLASRIVRDGRASTLEMIHELHQWAKASGLPRSSRRQSRFDEDESRMAKLVFHILTASEVWVSDFLRHNLSTEEWDRYFYHKDDKALFKPDMVVFPVPKDERAAGKLIEDAMVAHRVAR